MSQNPFSEVRSPERALRNLALRVRNLERRPGSESRRVFGQVDGGDNDTGFGPGILDPGSGDWSIATDGSGTWTITVDPPFQGIPTVVAAQNYTTTDPRSSVTAETCTVDTIVVSTHNVDGDLAVDIGFNFIAVSA